MPGFRHCSWCDGKGCMCCDREEKKFAEKALANAPKWRAGDIRDIRDAWVEAELNRRFRGLDAMTPDEVEELFKPALDAEYARQFPNGPQPIFTATLGNASDMALLKSVFGRGNLEAAFGPDGGGMERIEQQAGEARATQALRDYAYGSSSPS